MTSTPRIAAWLALASMAGCPVEYTVPFDTDAVASSSESTAAPCDADLLDCDGACVDVESDAAHCGECGHTCGDAEACIQGECFDTCGNACDLITEVCDAGMCQCRSGFDRCGDVCVDLDSDPAHCGQCDEFCAETEKGEIETQSCQLRMCLEHKETCTPPLVACGQSCVDLGSHPLHCNSCNRSCNGDESCVDGECVPEL